MNSVQQLESWNSILMCMADRSLNSHHGSYDKIAISQSITQFEN